MTNRIFINKFGKEIEILDDNVEHIEKVFNIVHLDNSFVLKYDKKNNLYSFPCDNDIVFNENPQKTFKVSQSIYDNGIFYIEEQTFKIYFAESINLDGFDLCICEINKILQKFSLFDATQQRGFKNAYARVRKL